MNEDPANKITVLVNVHNRHKHLARQLDYLQSHYARILVFDSSDVEYAGKNDYSNVEYYYYPNWEYVDKLADIIKKVQTPYVHLCADDDFYVPESVESCVVFLDEHLDYASAHGHYLAFHWNGVHFDTYPLYRNYIGRDIHSDNVAIRLKEIFSPYIQLLYSVHRTENLKRCFCLASEKKVVNHRLVELLVSIIAAINGKHKVLPIFYGARETLYNSAGTFVPTINDVMKAESFEKELRDFECLIASYIAQYAGIPEGEAIQLFKEAFLPYVENRSRRMKQLPQLLPASLRIRINRLRYRGGELAGIGVESSRELNEIETFVRKHNC